MNKNKFINYAHNKYLYTNDNWKTVEKTDNTDAPQGYKKESNLNKALEARLKYEFGLKPAALIIKELKTIQKKRGELLGIVPNKNCGYGDEFEIFSICVLHDVTVDEAIKSFIVNGSEDGGIDAVFYNDDECTVYQIKVGAIEIDAIDKMKDRIKTFHNHSLSTQPNCSNLLDFLNKMSTKIDDFAKIEYKTISFNKDLCDNFNSNQVFLDFIEKRTTQQERKKRLILNLKDSIGSSNKYTFSSDNNIFFMFADAKSLIDDIIGCFGSNDFETFFSNNVRGDLGINEEMRKTIVSYPESFCSFNNGISITGSFIANKNAFKISVENPCIVNGQQTIFNLYKAILDGIDIQSIKVPVFVKRFETLDVQAKIARYNNTQKSVSAIDLLSIDNNLRKLQRILLKNINDPFYLNLISSGKKKYVSIARTTFGKDKIIKIVDFVKLYSVIRHPKELGPWKNNFNAQVSLYYSNGFPECDYDVAKCICESIVKSRELILLNKSKYAIADLAIQFLLSLGIPLHDVQIIIDKTTNDNSGMKPADVYKSKFAYSKIKKFIPKKFSDTLPN